MNVLSKLADHARSEGDPTVIESGPSSRGMMDNLTGYLGWFSIGLGLTELIATKQLTRALGMEGKEALIRAYGVREIVSGVACLSVDRQLGAWSRVGGDAIDIATLASAYNDDNEKKQNVGWALAAVAGITVLDIVAAQGVSMRHRRGKGERRDYSSRSGWPNGLSHSRGAAADFRRPDDMQQEPGAAQASGVTGRTSPASAALMEDEVAESTSVLGSLGDGKDKTARLGQ